MKAKNRKKLVIVDSYLSERVLCAICAKPVLPVMGPAVYLADNLHGSDNERPTKDKPTGMVCWKCTEKHEPDFNRLMQLGHEAGVFWTQPYFAIVGGRRATVAPYGGWWYRLWWWKGDTAPRLDFKEDAIVFDHGQTYFFAPKKWGWDRLHKYTRSGEVPREGKGWKRITYQMPTV